MKSLQNLLVGQRQVNLPSDHDSEVQGRRISYARGHRDLVESWGLIEDQSKFRWLPRTSRLDLVLLNCIFSSLNLFRVFTHIFLLLNCVFRSLNLSQVLI